MIGLVSSQQQHQNTKTPAQLAGQKLLDEARTKLKLEHAEATRAVVDPSATKPQRLTARRRAEYPKLTATDNILTAVAADRWAILTSSDQYLLKPDRLLEEPFYAQLEEIRRIHAQFSLLARCSHAQVDSQALLKPDRLLEEPFYAQLEEIRRIHAQFSLLARCSHAQVDSQASC